MSKAHEIKGFWSYLWTVVVEPWWFNVIFGFTVTALGVFFTIRNEFASEEWQKRLATPHIQGRSWICVALAGAIVSVIRNAYSVWSEQQQVIADKNALIAERDIKLSKRTLPASAPELEVIPGATEDMAPALGGLFLIRNASQQFSVQMLILQPQRISDTYLVSWDPSLIPIVDRRVAVQVCALPANVGSGPAAVTLLGLADILFKKDPKANIHNFKFMELQLTCEDNVGNRYWAHCDLYYSSQRKSISVGPVFKKLLL